MNGDYDIETPTLRLKVYEHGRLVAQIVCESEEEAADAMAQWDEAEGVECELEDLGARHDVLDVRAPEPEDVVPADEYRARPA